MVDSRTRRLSVVTGERGEQGGRAPGELPEQESGLADVRTLQRAAAQTSTPADERDLFQDAVAEYLWARDVAALSPLTLESLVKPVLQICSFYDTVPWRLSPRDLDRYFAGPGRAPKSSTTRSKITRIDGFFAFLEQRYAGEILRRFGAAVESPIDAFNRPRHRGDFGLRVPPSAAALKQFFASWRAELPLARKYPVAVRNYVMSKIAYISGVRAAELCGVRIGDVHWENGQWGRFLVRGKGAGAVKLVGG